MISRVYYKLVSGRYKILHSNIGADGGYFVEWAEATVKRWLPINRLNFVDRETAIWDQMLVSTNLVTPPYRDSFGNLLKEVREKIFSYPSVLIAPLVRQFLRSVELSRREVYQIEQECSTLFGASSGSRTSVNNPHPVVERACLSMLFSEKFKIPFYASVEEMPYSVLQGFRLVASVSDKMMESRQTAEDLRQQAKRLAGHRS